MGLLVGLPLKLFHLLFVILRLLWPLLLVLLVRWLLRRHQSRPQGTGSSGAKEPEFKGPVYTVDYEEVDDEKKDGQ